MAIKLKGVEKEDYYEIQVKQYQDLHKIMDKYSIQLGK